MGSDLAKTPLYDWHVAHGGRMVDFAGWAMPVQYTSITDEHQATRTRAGIFDISHMGRLGVTGPDAASFLDSVLTRRVADMEIGQIRYSLVCNDEGGILDDVLVYRNAFDEPPYGLVVNASNREKIVAWLNEHRSGRNVDVRDDTTDSAMIAVQGPAALEMVGPLLDLTPTDYKSYTGAPCNIAGHEGYFSRTGYTGEDGCELIVSPAAALPVWNAIVAQGGDSISPAGLGCRDTLRLEAAMPLYGHELSEEINPVQAGLKFGYNLNDREFIGRDAIARFETDESQPRRIGLTLAGRRVPREHYPILADGEPVGHVTSGTFSPTLGHPIAMGYVPREHAKQGTALAIDVRGRAEGAEVVKLPFYKRKA